MAKLRCWPGAIAIISNHGKNDGHLVECVSFDVVAESWECIALAELSGYDDDGNWVGFIHPGEHCIGPDDELIPITPPPNSITQEEVRELFNPQPTKETA